MGQLTAITCFSVPFRTRKAAVVPYSLSFLLHTTVMAGVREPAQVINKELK